MKATNKLLAILLTVCMLLAMPLSINVSAFGTSDSDAATIKAVVLPDKIADELGVSRDRAIMLIFNRQVTIDVSKVSAGFGFVNATTGTAVGAMFAPDSATGNSIRTGASIQEFSASGDKKYYVVSLPSGYTVSNLFSVFNNRAGYEVVVRLFDSTDGTNDVIDGVVNNGTAWSGTTKSNKYCQSNANINTGTPTNNKRDYTDIPIVDALTLNSAEWTADNTIRITFSQPGKMRRSNGADVYCGIRLVNANGKLMYYNPNAEGNKYSTTAGGESLQAAANPTSEAYAAMNITITQQSTVAFGDFAAGSVKTLSWFNAHLEACCAENPSETFTISYVMESKEWTDNSNYFTARGEAANNWVISGFYSNNAAAVPLMATDSASTTGCDSVVMGIVDPIHAVTLQSLTRNSLTDFTLKFSEAVTLKGGSNFGLCVMKDGKIISSKKLVVGSWRTNAEGTTHDTWRLGFHHNDYSINNGNSIFTYAMGEFTDELKAQGAQLCFYIADQSSTTADGWIDSVYTQTGRKLKNDSGINSTDTKETYFIPVQVEDMGFTPTAYVSNGTLLLSTPGLSGIGGWSGATTYLRAYDDNGNVLSIDSKAAQWRLSVNSSARYNGAGSLYCSSELLITDTEGHGVSKYDGIVALLDQEYPNGYHLEMVVDDAAANAKNGFVENMAQYNSSLGQVSAYLLASELYSTDTLDVAVIPFGEMVTVDSVDVYDSGKAILTFSHDIDIDALIAAHTNYKDFFLTISTPGENSYVVDTNDYDGDGNTTEPLAQTAMGDIQRYGDNNNKIIATLSPDAYKNMMDIYGAKTESDNWAIRMRIEMETGYVKNVGKIPVNDNIVATKEGVLSPYMPAFWGTDVISGRVWTDVNLVDAADGAISVNGVQTNDLSAITAAPAGSEIIMIDNAVVESGGFNVPSGVVLDLNGKTITMSENTAINVIGTIMDNTDGGALIKVANKNTATVAIPGSNPQMPLYDTADGGYRLFHKEFKAQGVKEGSNANPADTTAKRYGVHLHFDNMKAYELLAAGGTDVKLTLKLYAEGYVDVPLYTFQESTLKEYGQSCLNATAEKPLSGKTIVLTVFGIDKLNGTPLNVSATLNFMGTTAIGDAVPVV